MLQRLRRPEPFGKAGLMVAVFALVVAMAGGAYAAGALSGKQKKEVEKIAKKFAGKPGANGQQGAAGANGTNGTNGKDGASGNPGAPGKDGTFSTEPLPPKQTLTGVWHVAGPEGHYYAQISFPIEVSPAPTALIQANEENYGYLIKDGEATFYPEGATNQLEAEEAWEIACPGDAGEPQATPGFLCMYFSGAEHAFITRLSTQFELAHEFGLLVPLELGGSATEESFIKGSWAVEAAG
jgi:hypothetical protein